MDPKELKERLMRLNVEIQSDRFKGRDLRAVVAVWGEAVRNFDNNNFGMAEDLADRAYGLLYAPYSPAAPPQQPPAQFDIQPMPVYAVYETTGSDKLMVAFGEFMNMTLNILLKPSKVFDLLTRIKAVEETLTYFAVFGVIYALVYVSMLSPFIGLSLSLIQNVPMLALGGFLMCVVSSYLAYLVMMSFKGKGAYIQTASVFGFSLVPLIISGLLLIYLRYATSFFTSKELVDLIPGAAIASLVVLAGICWNIFLQALGLRIIHGVDQEKCLAAAATSLVTSALMIAVMGAVIYLSNAAA